MSAYVCLYVYVDIWSICVNRKRLAIMCIAVGTRFLVHAFLSLIVACFLPCTHKLYLSHAYIHTYIYMYLCINVCMHCTWFAIRVWMWRRSWARRAATCISRIATVLLKHLPKAWSLFLSLFHSCAHAYSHTQARSPYLFLALHTCIYICCIFLFPLFTLTSFFLMPSGVRLWECGWCRERACPAEAATALCYQVPMGLHFMPYTYTYTHVYIKIWLYMYEFIFMSNTIYSMSICKFDKFMHKSLPMHAFY